MSNCSVCNSPSGVFHSQCQDGAICKNCMSFIPSTIYPHLKTYSSKRLRKILSWVSKTHNKNINDFEISYSYGNVHVDDLHGLFAICDKKEIKDKRLPQKNYNIYPLIELTDMAFSMQIVEAEEHCVTVKIVFSCELNKPNVKFNVIIKDRAKCYAHRNNSESLKYSEPEDLTMFRSMFYQSYKNAIEKYNYNFERTVSTKEEFDLFKAKCVFMVDEVYTKDEIDKQYARLNSLYKDNSNESKKYKEIIRTSYEMLKKHLRKNV